MPTAANREEMPLLKQLDLLLLAAALPVFLIAGLPMLAYGVVAAVWLVIRGLELAVARRTQGALAAGDRRRATGADRGLVARPRLADPARGSARGPYRRP